MCVQPQSGSVDLFVPLTVRVRLVLAPQMTREGPCRVEGCKDPETSAGQWQYIPEEYCDEHAPALPCLLSGCAGSDERTN